MGMPKSKQRKLDDQALFNQYYNNPNVKSGTYSYNKLYAWAVKEYGYVTESAVWQSVQRYMIRNYKNTEVENAFAMWFVNCELNPPTHEEYLLEVSKRAKTVFNPKQYKNWCAKHPDIEYLE